MKQRPKSAKLAVLLISFLSLAKHLTANQTSQLEHLADKLVRITATAILQSIQAVLKKPQSDANIAHFVGLAHKIDQFAKTHKKQEETLAGKAVYATIKNKQASYLKYLVHNSYFAAVALIPDVEELLNNRSEDVRTTLEKNRLPSDETTIENVFSATKSAWSFWLLKRGQIDSFSLGPWTGLGTVTDIIDKQFQMLTQPFDLGTHQLTALEVVEQNKWYWDPHNTQEKIITYLKNRTT